VGVVVALLWILIGCRRQESEQKPEVPRDANVLLLTLDTTRADHLSCYVHDDAAAKSVPLKMTAQSGPGYAQTPHLGALAVRGVRFTHAVAQVPLTLPSHACILTGTYPEVHGLRDMGGFVLDPRQVTLASMAGQGTASSTWIVMASSCFIISTPSWRLAEPVAPWLGSFATSNPIHRASSS
jgi:sulfatase-like protein